MRVDKDGKITGNFTKAQIRKKYRILREAGFEKAQIKQLMDSGTVGLMQRYSRWSRNKTAKKTSKQAKEDVDRAVISLFHQDKMESKLELSPKNKDRYDLERIKSGVEKDLTQAQASLQAAKNAANKLASGSRTEKLALQRIEKADTYLKSAQKISVRAK